MRRERKGQKEEIVVSQPCNCKLLTCSANFTAACSAFHLLSLSSSNSLCFKVP